MLLLRSTPTLSLLVSISLISISACKPLQHFDVPDHSDDNNLLVGERHIDYESSLSVPEDHNQFDERAATSLNKRTETLTNCCQLIQRYQQSAIVPTVSSIAALKGFWQTISMKALYYSAFGEEPKYLFTITEGVLQATFSCLGQEVPWDFVRLFAMKLVGMVDMGWTDTFDAVYELEKTGVVLWVSLRVLVKATKRKKPKAGT